MVLLLYMTTLTFLGYTKFYFFQYVCSQNLIAQTAYTVKVHYSLDNFNAKNPVVTTGTFDGLHKGHQLVIKRLKQLAKDMDGESVILTFYPHPRVVTSPDENNLRLLTTKDEKIRLFDQFGIDHLIIYPFDKAFSQLSYSDFIKKIIIGGMGTKCLVVGYDHRFGKNREGDYEYLKKCAGEYDFTVKRTEALSVETEKVSSTKIRAALESGEIKKANGYLGYSFMLNGTVIKGNQLGREMGFPTANIQTSDKNKIIPGYGVYAVYIEKGDKHFKGMLNIGSRPTFNNNADNRSIEVNIFDFDSNIYGENLNLIFVDKIRNEKKFNGVKELSAQLAKDKNTATTILNS